MDIDFKLEDRFFSSEQITQESVKSVIEKIILIK
jgi:hypothetical protein